MSERFKTLLALDIDQTLATNLVKTHLLHYNQELKLEMSEQEIHDANNLYHRTFDVPQIIRFREQDEEKFQSVRKKILRSDEVNLSLDIFPNAKDAITLFASSITHTGYYTVRPPEILQSTKLWLQKYNLPNSEHVTLCQSHEHKIKSVIQDAIPEKLYPVLIDDSLLELMTILSNNSAYAVLSLIGFGEQATNLLQSMNVDKQTNQVTSIANWNSESISKVNAIISSQ